MQTTAVAGADWNGASRGHRERDGTTAIDRRHGRAERDIRACDDLADKQAGGAAQAGSDASTLDGPST